MTDLDDGYNAGQFSGNHDMSGINERWSLRHLRRWRRRVHV